MFGKFLEEERGSISVLISGLYILALILSVGIIDISDSFLAKRELLQIGEDAVLVASHSLDENRYYLDAPSAMSFSNPRVPIDCAAAAIVFNAEISSRELRSAPISVSGWSCSNDQITASISSEIRAIVNFPILSSINGDKIRVDATIGATSEIGGG